MKEIDLLSAIGRKVALLRKEQKMSQEELAAASGKMINTISNIERGLSDPKVSTLLAIAQTLNIRIENLFTDNNVAGAPHASNNLKQINDLLQNEDERMTELALKQIKLLLEVKNK